MKKNFQTISKKIIEVKKLTRHLASREGFTLVETIVAIGVLLLAIAGPMTLARQSLKVGPVSKEHITAFFLAQDAIEFVKNARDTNTATGDSWLTGLTPCQSGCIVDTSVNALTVGEAIKIDDGSCTPLRYDSATGRYGCNPAWTASKYSRQITLTTDVPDQEATLTAVISWTENGRPLSFTAKQSLFNIGDAIQEGISRLDPAVLSGGSPSGTLQAGTVQALVTVQTNKNATCRWDFASVDYALMGNTFTITGGMQHSTTVTGLTDGTSYTLYVRCVDQLGQENVASYPISFSVANPTGGGIVAHWPFDSNANDISGNGHHGTLTNGAVVSTASKIGPGSLSLDGIDDYVTVPSHTSLQGNQNLTFSFWFKKTQATSTKFATKSSGSTSKDWELGSESTGNFDFESELANSNYSLQSADGLIALNTWYHAAAVMDKTNGKLTLYINGSQVAQDVAFGSTNSDGTTAPVHIGRRGYGTNNLYHKGNIDDFRIYNFAMTPAQIAAIYNAGVGSSAATPTFDNVGSATCGTVTAPVTTCTLSGFPLGNGSGNNRLVVVNVTAEDDVAVAMNNVTFNGVAGTEVQEFDWVNGTPALSTAQWYFLDNKLPATAGNYNIVATISPAADRLKIIALSYKNLFQAAPTGSNGAGCTACSAVSTTFTVPDNNSLIVAGVQSGSASNFTGNNGITKRGEIDDGSSSAGGGDKIITASGSIIAGFNSTANVRHAVIASSWKPLASSGDTTAPSAVSNLAVSNPTANTLTVSWTAPGDDGAAGTATSYDLRRSTAPIVTATDWANATIIPGEPAPSAGGSPEVMVVTGLNPSTTYYFALKTSDEVPNTSGISNSPNGTTAAGTGGSLVAYWPFNVDASDQSGNGYDGVLTNGAAVSATSPKVGAGSLALDGTNDYVNTEDIIQLNGAQKASISLWIKENATPSGWDHFISKSISGSIDLRIALSSTALNVDIGDGATDTYASWTYGTNLPLNTWHHVVIVFDGTQVADANKLKLYTDNVQRTFTSITGPLPSAINGALSGTTFKIGSFEGSTGMVGPGNIDDVRVYNYSLTPAEITTLFNLGTGGDAVAPAAITGATVNTPTLNSLKLNWTAPGDDGSTGTATAYDIRYSTSAITSDALFNAASQVVGEPAPAVAGTAQSMTISGLAPGTTYFFAIKTADEVPNNSAVSNSPSGTTSTGGAGSMIAYWPFDTNMTDSQGAYNGTAAGNAAITTVNKIIGAGALTLDGTGDYVNVGDITQLNLAQKFSISAWYRDAVPASATGRYTFAKFTDSNNKISAGANTNQFYVNIPPGNANVNGIWSGYGATIPANTWYHAVIVFDGTQATNDTRAKLYINNVQRTMTFNGTIPANTVNLAGKPFLIGTNTIDANWWQGQIDDMRVYNYALTPAEISTLFSMGSGGDTTAPAAIAGATVLNPTASSLTLNWTAPGDDGSTGTATSYDIRYSTSAITAGNWASATQVVGEPTPQTAGTAQSMQINGLNPGTTYFFAIMTSDEVPNTSAISNSPSGTTVGGSLVARWPFDTNMIDSVGGIVGTAVGNAAVTTAAKMMGVGSLALDGTGDYVTAGDVLDVANGESFSAAFWFKRASNITADGLFAKRANFGSTNVGYISDINASNDKLWVNVGDGVDDCHFGTNTTFLDTNWHHAVVVWDGTNAGSKIYIDGVADVGTSCTNAASVGTISNTQPFRIGAYSDNTNPLDGNIDDFRFYDYALTASEVSTLYNSVNAAVLVGHWPFDANANDSSGNGLNGTLIQQAAITATAPKVGAGSVVFDGTGDEVVVAANPLLNITGAVSIAGWAKVTDTAVTRSILTRNGGAGFRGYSLRFNTGNTAEFHVSSDCTVENVVPLSGTVTPGTWVHLAGTYEPGVALKIYLNGVLNNSVTTGVPAAQCNNSDDVVMGGRPNGTQDPMLGNLDDVRLYTGVLTQTEITNLYNLGVSSDVTAPAAIAGATVSNPTTNSLQLNWTAPGDDGSTGTATSYDIRYSTAAITAGNWGSATQVTGEPVPAVAGTAQNMTISGLNPSTTYFFAIMTSDEVPNTSSISNSPSGTTAAASALVAHWPFDSNYTDAAGSFDGTPAGNATVTTTQHAVGVGSLALDGTGDYVSTGDLTALNSASKFSVSAWFRDATPASATGRYTFGKWSASQTENSSGANTNEFYVNVRTGVAEYGKWTGYGAAIPANTWFHAVMVYDGTQTGNANRLKLYVNNVQQTLAFTGTIQASSNNFAGIPFLIGTQQTTAGYWNGLVDDMRVYNYALTSAEITSLFNLADMTAPAAVSNLAVTTRTTTTVDLTWTAPGDDGSTGTATSYDIRRSTSPITTNAQFNSATAVTGEPTPGAAGAAQSMTVTGLTAGTTYYFAMKTSDESNNISTLSNNPSGQTIPTNILVSNWTFDASGADAQGAYNGTLNGNAATNATAPQIGAKALLLDGAGDYVQTADITQINGATSTSVSFWLKYSTAKTATFEYLFSKTNTGVKDYAAAMNNTSLNFEIGDGTADVFFAWTYGANLAANAWHHIVIVFDGTQTGNTNRVKLYTDNVQRTVTFTGTVPATINNLATIPFFIGSKNATAGFWNGRIDAFRLYKRPLNTNEINALYNETP